MSRGASVPPGGPPEVVADVCRRHGLAELYAFGSRGAEIAARIRGGLERVGGGSHGSSDVDVGVRPLPGRRLSVEELVTLAGDLEVAFDVSRVDVVPLPSAPPFLALEAVRGELLYCADPDAQAEFELYVLRRAGDLAPFQRARHGLVLSRGRSS